MTERPPLTRYRIERGAMVNTESQLCAERASLYWYKASEVEAREEMLQSLLELKDRTKAGLLCRLQEIAEILEDAPPQNSDDALITVSLVRHLKAREAARKQELAHERAKREALEQLIATDLKIDKWDPPLLLWLPTPTDAARAMCFNMAKSRDELKHRCRELEDELANSREPFSREPATIKSDPFDT